MSAIFQRPLCEMGAAYDYSFRPVLGDPEVGDGGPCDDRPHRVELAPADASTEPPRIWRSFLLCPEHETQLRRNDGRLTAQGGISRFRALAGGAPVPAGAQR